MTTTNICKRRIWHGPREALRVVRVRVWARAVGAELAARAWAALAEAAGDCPPLAEDWDAGPHCAAFLTLASDGLAAELAATIAAVAGAAGVAPDDLAEVVGEELALPAGIHRFGDGQSGTVLLALDGHEAIVAEDSQRLPA